MATEEPIFLKRFEVLEHGRLPSTYPDILIIRDRKTGVEYALLNPATTQPQMVQISEKAFYEQELDRPRCKAEIDNRQEIWQLILKERNRQIEELGYTTEHDNHHGVADFFYFIGKCPEKRIAPAARFIQIAALAVAALEMLQRNGISISE